MHFLVVLFDNRQIEGVEVILRCDIHLIYDMGSAKATWHDFGLCIEASKDRHHSGHDRHMFQFSRLCNYKIYPLAPVRGNIQKLTLRLMTLKYLIELQGKCSTTRSSARAAVLLIVWAFQFSTTSWRYLTWMSNLWLRIIVSHQIQPKIRWHLNLLAWRPVACCELLRILVVQSALVAWRIQLWRLQIRWSYLHVVSSSWVATWHGAVLVVAAA